MSECNGCLERLKGTKCPECAKRYAAERDKAREEINKMRTEAEEKPTFKMLNKGLCSSIDDLSKVIKEQDKEIESLKATNERYRVFSDKVNNEKNKQIDELRKEIRILNTKMRPSMATKEEIDEAFPKNSSYYDSDWSEGGEDT